MFGGIGYMLNENMCIGIHKDDLIIRYDPSDTDKLLAEKNVKYLILLATDEGLVTYHFARYNGE